MESLKMRLIALWALLTCKSFSLFAIKEKGNKHTLKWVSRFPTFLSVHVEEAFKKIEKVF